MIGLLLLACLPASDYTPTPVIYWDHSYLVDCDSNGCLFNRFEDYGNLEGFRVYARQDGQPFERVWELPCWLVEDESGGFVKSCPVQHAAQRGGPWDLEYVEFTVVAYNSIGESSSSNNVNICMPHIWRPGEVYE
jgi:hypothetical protein